MLLYEFRQISHQIKYIQPININVRYINAFTKFETTIKKSNYDLIQVSMSTLSTKKIFALLLFLNKDYC